MKQLTLQRSRVFSFSRSLLSLSLFWSCIYICDIFALLSLSLFALSLNLSFLLALSFCLRVCFSYSPFAIACFAALCTFPPLWSWPLSGSLANCWFCLLSSLHLQPAQPPTSFFLCDTHFQVFILFSLFLCLRLVYIFTLELASCAAIFKQF